MKELNGSAVSFAKLKEGLFILGLGNIGDTLPSLSKSLDLKMTHTETGVHVVDCKSHIEFLTPWANVLAVRYVSGPTSVSKAA